MDVVHFVHGTAIAPPGAYAVEEQPNRVQQGSQPASREMGSHIVDSYTPSRSTDVAPDMPAALRHSPDAAELTTCYCGHCTSCQAKQAEQATTNTHPERLAQKRDPAQASEAPDTRRPEKEEPEGKQELTEAEQRQVEDLQQRDQEVRAHEQAHAAAGGRNVRYDYQLGPDGQQYAVGGSADIDMTAMSDDRDSKISEARKMRAAALAPADPSTQDMAVAAKASRLERDAMTEKADTQREAIRAEADAAPANDAAAPFALHVSKGRTVFYAMG